MYIKVILGVVGLIILAALKSSYEARVFLALFMLAALIYFAMGKKRR